MTAHHSRRKGRALWRWAVMPAMALCAAAGAQSTEPAESTAELEVGIVYLSHDSTPPPPLSPLDLPAPDAGLAGARLGIADNNTTGAFLGQHYHLQAITLSADTDTTAQNTLPDGQQLIVADLPREVLRAVAARHPHTLFFNVRAEDDALRGAECATNIFHIAPSRAMKADALAQYLAWKDWRKWLLVRGQFPADDEWTDALTRAAKKFGLQIVETRTYAYEAGTRRTDTGHMQIQKQLPAFLRDARAHDVVVAADESEVFAGYLPYRLWSPRPVAGSAGLRPVAWHPAAEQWGATQLQRRFIKAAGRRMGERDYLAWLALRVIGEALVRRPQTTPESLREYLVDDDFSVAGFKGQALTFRAWNRQLRQPILLAGARMVVSVSPQPAFLHQHSHLDTLGAEARESPCK